MKKLSFVLEGNRLTDDSSKKVEFDKKTSVYFNKKNDDTDEDFFIIANYLNGDEKAFKKLITRHKEKVRNLIYLTLGNNDYVDDIAQEVFITIFKNIHKFRFESLFTTWLYRITVNKCKDHIRKMKIRSIVSYFKDDDENNYPFENENIDFDSKKILKDAIASLPDKLKTPLILKDIEGLSYKEIADTVNCEVGTVKSRIFRARETLRLILKPYQSDLI